MRLAPSAKGSKDAEKIERDLMAVFPQDTWTWLAHALIEHGRRVLHGAQAGVRELSAGGGIARRRTKSERRARQRRPGAGEITSGALGRGRRPVVFAGQPAFELCRRLVDTERVARQRQAVIFAGDRARADGGRGAESELAEQRLHKGIVHAGG